MTSYQTVLDGGTTWLDVEGNLSGADGTSARSVGLLHREPHSIWFASSALENHDVFVYRETGDGERQQLNTRPLPQVSTTRRSSSGTMSGPRRLS